MPACCGSASVWRSWRRVLLAFVPRLPSADASNGFGLSNGSVRITSGTNRRLRVFAVTQIAASFLLLAGAGALLTTLFALQKARSGINTHNVRSRRLVPDVIRTLPFETPMPFEVVGRRQARHERQQHRGDQRQPGAHPQHAGIDREVQRAHREARSVARQHRHHRPRDQHAEHRAGAAEQQAFGEQRPAQRAGAGAERRADRQLPFAANRPRQNQVGDVRAGDDEHQRRGREQHQQNGSRRRRDLVAQPHRVDAKVGLRRIRFGMLAAPSRRAPRAVRRAPCSRSAPGARRPNSSVMRCTRPVTIVADR